MLALRKRRMASTHPFLRGGFRPFFLGAASWAFIAIALWLAAVSGHLTLPSLFEGVAWHRHEMLFGFVGAAVTGFLLTAIPNWTGRLPIAGRPLVSLFGLWALARLAVLFSATMGLWPAALLDVGSYLALALLAGREVIASKNRNLATIVLLFFFGTADALDYLELAGMVSEGLGWRAAIVVITIMISVIGGRIIPSFTRNWMAKNDIGGRRPTQPASLDLLIIASTSVALVFWLVVPGNRLTGPMLILASLAQIMRLSRWGGARTSSDPLVLVLHLGYLWLPVGLFLLGLSAGGVDIPQSAGVHALTAGAMATLILAVMTRASLGHTGRELKASKTTMSAYYLVTVGALVRVAASLGMGSHSVMLNIAGAFWAGAMLLFLLAYVPILWRPRLGE